MPRGERRAVCAAPSSCHPERSEGSAFYSMESEKQIPRANFALGMTRWDFSVSFEACRRQEEGVLCKYAVAPTLS